jgi:hypothetical protein
MKASAYADQLKDNSRFYAQAVILFVLLRKVAPKTEWNHRLADLIGKYKEVSTKDVGFPSNWQSESFWGLNK